jgi:hypothetical protein
MPAIVLPAANSPVLIKRSVMSDTRMLKKSGLIKGRKSTWNIKGMGDRVNVIPVFCKSKRGMNGRGQMAEGNGQSAERPVIFI